MTAVATPPRRPTNAGRPRPISDELHYVLVRANLLPTEVVDARRADAVRRKALLGLVTLVVALLVGYGYSWWQTHSARSDLAALQARGDSLTHQQTGFAPLVQAQTGTQAIHDRLHTLMQGDLPWYRMLATLRHAAPQGVTVTSVTGALSTGVGVSGSAPAAGATLPDPSAKPQIGSVVLTGTAPSKAAVAAFADRLARVRGVSGVLVANVAATDHGFTFSVDAVLTADALGGRYAGAAAAGTTGTTGTTSTGGH